VNSNFTLDFPKNSPFGIHYGFGHTKQWKLHTIKQWKSQIFQRDGDPIHFENSSNYSHHSVITWIVHF